MPEFNAFQIIIILGLVNGAILFLSLSALPKRFKEPAKILGFFILGYTAYISNWTIFASLGYHYDVSIIWVPSLYFLPALTYLFARSILSYEPISKRDMFYLVPGALDLVFQFGKWIWSLANHDGYYFPLDDRTEFFIYEGIGLLFGIFCVTKVVLLVKKTDFKKNDSFKFYKYAFIFLLFVLFRWLAIYLLDIFQPSLLTFNLQFSFWSVDLVFFLLLGYRSLVAPKKFISVIAKKTDNDSYRESKEIATLIQSQKLFLNPDFNRKELSARTGLTEVKISDLIGNQLQTTFYELVNRLRAIEAKDLLENGSADQHTMEAIAHDAGFKSKTTFYKFFKQEYGMNPRDYLKKLKA